MERSTRDKAEELDAVRAPGSGDGARGRGQADRGMGAGGGMGMGGTGMGGGRGISFRNLRTFSSLKNPVFRLYYCAMLAQMAAMNVQMFARLFLVYQVGDESIFILGLMGLANGGPMLLFSLFGGVIADRVQKKYVLLAGQAGSAVVSLAIAVTLSLGMLSVDRAGSWLFLIVAALVQGTIMGLMMPARQAMIAEIVDADQLMNAVALNMFGMNFFRILGPGLAGFAVGWFGYESLYYAMTAMYLVAVFFIAIMPLTGTMVMRGRGALADMKDGLQYVRHDSILLLILVFTMFIVLLSMPYMMLLPAIADKVLNVAEQEAGLLMSVSGIGAVAASIVLASLPNRKRGLMLLLSGLVTGLAILAFSFSPWFSVSLGIMVVLGAGQTARMTLANTLLQYYVQAEYRGRVMSLYMMEFGLTSFGVFFAAVLAESIGIQWSVGGLAILLVIFSALAVVFVPRLRRLE